MWGTSAAVGRSILRVGFPESSVKSTVQDLGVCQREYRVDTVLSMRLENAVQIARQVGIVGLERNCRVQQIRSMVYAGGLYGVEIMVATQLCAGHTKGRSGGFVPR